MRQGQEKQIYRLDGLGVAELEHAPLAQVGMHLVDIFSQVTARGHLD